MLRFLRVAAVAGAATLALGGYAGIAGATSHSSAPTTTSSTTSQPVLVSVRAGHHNGFDRIVMEFSGSLPSQRNIRWVDQVTSDGSGQPIRVAGHRFFELSVSSAVAHTSTGQATVPSRQTYALPNITQSVIAGDFEGVVTLGVGLQRHTVTHMYTLTSPSRIVVDTQTPFTTTNVNVYFLNVDRYATGTQPYRIARPRPVIPPLVAAHALERLFAGPTQWERAHALRFVSSHATGFTGLQIDNGIARVQLTGGCASNGSTFTVANLIFPTLKQFASVDHVKIYGPQGFTEQPNGNVDSIPPCLEP
jgi:hypothetical protein